MLPPALDTALLRLSDATLLQVVETFLYALASPTSTLESEQVHEHLLCWCRALGFHLLVHEPFEKTGQPEEHQHGPASWRLLAPQPSIVRARIQRLSHLHQTAMERSFPRRAEGSSAHDSRAWSFPSEASDPDALAFFTLFFAEQRIVLHSKSALFEALQTLPIGSIFALSTTCHQMVVSHGHYCLILADAHIQVGLGSYPSFKKEPLVFEQVVTQPGIVGLPGRKLIGILQGDRRQLAFLEPVAYEEFIL